MSIVGPGSRDADPATATRPVSADVLDIARRSPLDLLSFLLGKEYLPSIFLDHLNRILLNMIYGKDRFLLISCPPRHGKSVLCSMALPAWYLGIFPKNRVLLGSYEASFARSWGRKTRDILEEHGAGLFGIGVRTDVSAVADWEVAEHGGGMMTAGIEGGFTGKGGNLIVIDDPVKNRAEAESLVYRDRAWSFFNSTVLPRREPGAAVLVIMQRWHQDDLIGRIKQEMPGSGYQEITFPAIADEDDALGRKVGEALFPIRFPVERLAEMKRDLSPYYWESQYQQKPSPPQGAIFLRKNWKFYDDIPENLDLIFQSWDMTFKDSSESHKVAGHVWGQRRPDYFLLDRETRRMGFTETLAAVEIMKKRHPRSRAILIEDKANGPAVIDVLKRKIAGVVPIEPKGGKIVRANAVEPVQRAGNVWLPNPEKNPWVKQFIEICANFPTGGEDDDVDAFTQAITWGEMRVLPGAFAVG